MDAISLEVLVCPNQENAEAFARLIPQLGGTAEPPTPNTVAKVLASTANIVLAARVDGRIAGLLVLVVLELPTGTEVRIGGVVVDPTVRRLGLGRALVAAAL